MRTRALPMLFAVLVATLGATAARAALDGSVTLGGTIVNQTGDRSAVQEMNNVYDGFTVSELRLGGTLAGGRSLSLDLRDVNLDSRQGHLVYRIPGLLRVNAALDQHRQIFSPAGDIHSMRRDWRGGAQLTPSRWLTLSGSYSRLARDGDRLAFPLGAPPGALGTRYDNALHTGQVTADLHRGPRGAAVTFQASRYTDELDPLAERSGQVVSARAWAPCLFTDRLTNFARAAYGVRRLTDRDLEWRLYHFGYTGVLEPAQPLRLRYRFQADRVDDQATDLRTDRFVNELDATWFHRYGQLDGGYGYETNDDDRTLTSTHGWQAGASLRSGRVLSARLEYAGRNKTDLEELTLLKDVESSRLRARLEVRPVPALVLGSTFARRERTFPDIRVELDGDVLTAYGRWEAGRWGTLSTDYTHAVDDYTDREGAFDLRSDVVSGRVETDLVPRLHLAAGVAWLDYGRGLDIEKSVVSAEGRWQVVDRVHLAAAYNAFNYDDYVLLDRYYTANVLRLGIGYDLHVH